MVAQVVTYASRNQLVDWLSGTEYEDEVPDGAGLDRLLLRASEVVYDAVAGQVTYDPDIRLPVGMVTPLDPPVTGEQLAEAFGDAVCAQVEQWLEVGESNDIAGYGEGTKLQLSAGAVTVLPDRLAPRAARRLSRAGLTLGGGDSATGAPSGPLTVELV